MSNEMLTRLTAKQEEARKAKETLVEKRATILQLAKDEGREDLNDVEDTEFRDLTGQIKTVDDDLIGRGERITELAEEEKRSANADRAVRRSTLAASDLRVTKESRTYEKGNGRSYLADLALAQVKGDPKSRERLERHAMEVEVDAEYRDLDRSDGTGGYFVPPAWLVADYIALARAGRPTANLVNNQALPSGTDSINIPKVSTGTATAIQTADNAAVAETDLADTSVAAGVKTVAGQQDVALQVLEQSPVNFDEIVFADLMADLATRVNVQVISGSNASGQVKGIRGSGGTAVAFTTASPTVALLYPKLADAIQKIHANRYMPPTVVVMHPRRWAWLLAALDSSSRPLVVPSGQGPQNAIGSFGGVVSEQVVGSIQGLPVVSDPSIPINLGAGTNEDAILVMRASDHVLWESALKTRVLPDVGSANLTVRLQVYSYLAFTAERYPLATSIIGGTGLVTPSF